jgi:hypothetical protein
MQNTKNPHRLQLKRTTPRNDRGKGPPSGKRPFFAPQRQAAGLLDGHAKITGGPDGATLKFCTQGRDLSQIMARAERGRDLNVNNRRNSSVNGKQMKTEARFPRLMDEVIDKIIKSGLMKAQDNYLAKLTEMTTTYNEKMRDQEQTGEGYIDESMGICWHK